MLKGKRKLIGSFVEADNYLYGILVFDTGFKYFRPDLYTISGIELGEIVFALYAKIK
jgi:hypothetical protein